jgi:prepilin-type N-terminal cleavage/methylation domain-containing protein
MGSGFKRSIDMPKKNNRTQTWEWLNRYGFIKPIRESLGSLTARTLEPQSKGFTLIEIIVVIVILSIISAISIKFLVDSLRIYTMTVNQKTLFDEGKLALERMCRDIRDANTILATTASSVAFTRTNATGTGQDSAGERIRFDLSGTTLRKVKGVAIDGSGGTPYTLANNVTAFTVANATNEIKLTLTLGLTSGENVTLQTSAYPKNLPKDTGVPPTYKNFYLNWQEVIQ